MRRSEKQPDRSNRVSGLLGSAIRATGIVLLRNPLTVGGGTAFLVALFFVSANALWYQPHAHTSAFFVTRQMQAYEPPTVGETHSVLIPRPAPERYRSAAAEPDDVPAPTPAPKLLSGDPTVKQVQEVLGELELYTGSIDGIYGPQTRKAVEEYQRIVGLDVSGHINDRLLTQLGASADSDRNGEQPLPTPRPSADTVQQAKVESPTVSPEAKPAARPDADSTIVRVQAGLKAFGNDHIEIDGVIGEQTRAAIREFQTLFGITVSGEADGELIAKMQEIGLIN